MSTGKFKVRTVEACPGAVAETIGPRTHVGGYIVGGYIVGGYSGYCGDVSARFS